MKKWTIALFQRVIWEMIGRPCHFLVFKKVYGNILKEIYNRRNYEIHNERSTQF